MRVTRSHRLGLAIVSIATYTLLSSPESHAQLPLEPIRDSGQGVTGSFEGLVPEFRRHLHAAGRVLQPK